MQARGSVVGNARQRGVRRHSVLQVANVASLAEPAVAEAQLATGEYHVIGYSCHDGTKPHAVAQKADHETYVESFASFALKPGEVVNVGYLHFGASRVGSNAFGRPVRTRVSVTDWPLAEIERFKQKRPQIYARMVTRLMTVTAPSGAPSDGDCTKLKALQSEGKVQALPASCATPAQSGHGSIKSARPAS